MPSHKSIISLLFLVILLTLVTFSPALKADFLNWDDEENVVYCGSIRSFGLQNTLWMFTNFTVGDFKPLVWLSYTLDYAIWDLNPFGYHLVNILLHGANTGLLFVLILHLWNLTGTAIESRVLVPPRTSVGVGLAAFLATLFFAIHPLRVESVAWISARKDVLCAFFFLSTLLAYLKYAAGKKVRWFILSLLLSLLALLSKPIAVSLPVILLLLDVYPLNRVKYGWGRILLEKGPFLLLALTTASLALYGQWQHAALVPLEESGLVDRCLLAFKSLFFYLQKTVLPFRLAGAYPVPDKESLWAWDSLLTLPAAVSITLLGIVLWSRGKKWLLFCWLWFLITLFPVSGFFRTGLVVAADRFTYIPAIGISMAIFVGINGLFKHRWKNAILSLVTLLILSVGFLCYRQTAIWDNSERLWKDSPLPETV